MSFFKKFTDGISEDISCLGIGSDKNERKDVAQNSASFLKNTEDDDEWNLRIIKKIEQLNAGEAGSNSKARVAKEK